MQTGRFTLFLRAKAGAALWLVLSACLANAASVTPDSVTTVDGPRNFLLARPASTPAGGRPLVLLLHGHGGSAAQLLGQKRSAAPLSVWLHIADREGLLLAALDGSTQGDGKPGWNDCRSDAVGNPPVDDVAFAAAVVRKLVTAGEVDPQRVYAMGMSNGAMMTLRLAQELEPPLAGFAAVSGLAAQSSKCQAPKQAVPAMLIMGTEDPLVPFAGGQVHFGDKLRGGVLSAAQTVDGWRRNNQAAGPAKLSAVPPTERTSRIERIQFGPDAGSVARVLFLRVQGGGHVEPSSSQRVGGLYARIVGQQNHDVEAAEEAWRFFSGWPVAPAAPAR
jgi:polyhydroxybutyrate depolymerase